VTIHPVKLDLPGSPTIPQKDMKDAIDAVVEGGLNIRRWGTLNATVRPYGRAWFKYLTPILHSVALEGRFQHG
jgi:hypothetical protein